MLKNLLGAGWRAISPAIAKKLIDDSHMCPSCNYVECGNNDTLGRVFTRISLWFGLYSYPDMNH